MLDATFITVAAPPSADMVVTLLTAFQPIPDSIANETVPEFQRIMLNAVPIGKL